MRRRMENRLIFLYHLIIVIRDGVTQEDLSKRTPRKSLTRAMVAPGERDRKIVGKQAWTRARKVL